MRRRQDRSFASPAEQAREGVADASENAFGIHSSSPLQNFYVCPAVLATTHIQLPAERIPVVSTPRTLNVASAADSVAGSIAPRGSDNNPAGNRFPHRRWPGPSECMSR